MAKALIRVPLWQRIVLTLMLCSGISSMPSPSRVASPGSQSGLCLPLNGLTCTRLSLQRHRQWLERVLTFSWQGPRLALPWCILPTPCLASGFAVVVLLTPPASPTLAVPLARAVAVAPTGSARTFVAAPLAYTRPSAAATQVVARARACLLAAASQAHV